MVDRDPTPNRNTNPLSPWAEELAAHPDDPMAHYNFAVACDQAGEPGKAVQALRNSITLNPCYGPAHYNLGSMLLMVGEAGEAVKAFREAVRLIPDVPQTHFMLGTACAIAGDPKGAFFATVNGLRLAPDDPRGQANAGRSAFTLGCFTDAALRYLLAARLDDEDLGLLLCLGTAVCRYVGVAPLELATGAPQFGLNEPEDVARFVMAYWALELDTDARSECARLLTLDAPLGQRVSEVIEGGTESRNRLLSLAATAQTDPQFVSVEVTP